MTQHQPLVIQNLTVEGVSLKEGIYVFLDMVYQESEDTHCNWMPAISFGTHEKPKGVHSVCDSPWNPMYTLDGTKTVSLSEVMQDTALCLLKGLLPGLTVHISLCTPGDEPATVVVTLEKSVFKTSATFNLDGIRNYVTPTFG